VIINIWINPKNKVEGLKAHSLKACGQKSIKKIKVQQIY
jgi:hypothetical protein